MSRHSKQVQKCLGILTYCRSRMLMLQPVMWVHSRQLCTRVKRAIEGDFEHTLYSEETFRVPRMSCSLLSPPHQSDNQNRNARSNTCRVCRHCRASTLHRSNGPMLVRTSSQIHCIDPVQRALFNRQKWLVKLNTKASQCAASFLPCPCKLWLDVHAHNSRMPIWSPLFLFLFIFS